tara:strand:+ start:144665 stop:147814 length:3150 start_codon:yes stop_codon:yes gene_type:complete
LKNIPSFTVYNASAGSGKTFTLVKEYLKTVLKSKSPGFYKQLLAITFTNKAVGEMKERIIKNLVEFSSKNAIDNPSEMLLQLSAELGLSVSEINRQSQKILKHLLHHYASFSVETIDRFNHQLIRTFARDLKINTNFEVSLDTAQLLAESVDQLISRAGEDDKITRVLIDFALEKADDDKSWDIAKDIVKTSALIFAEKENDHVKKLKERSLGDFLSFKSKLIQKREVLSEKIKEISTKGLELIDESGLEHSDFSRGSFPVYLLKLSIGDIEVNYDLQWQKTMEEKPMYTVKTAKAAPHIAETIDALVPQFVEIFESSKELVIQLQLTNAILKNLTPLSVINLVSHELQNIKEEKNILPISEFNSLINSEIKNQPAPFIYERLGEKYKHFFIDEFQDTSFMQWQNLVPLIDNALSQQDFNEDSGSLLLVGDAKQSIYRWRGGLPEQFIDLYNDKNPFSIEKSIENLQTNFRSCENIISFNNSFFTTSAGFFSNTGHEKLYIDGNEQLLNSKKGGYVKIEFIEKQNKAEKDKTYAQLVLSTIHNLLEKGFRPSDICILTRKKKDGILLGSYLMSENIPVISQETLLLQHSSQVECIIQTLSLSLFPENEEAKIELLDFLYDHLGVSEEKHSFFSNLLKTSSEDFTQKLKEYDVSFSFTTFHSLSLYEAVEYIIRAFGLSEKPDAYLFGFMDVVFEFNQQPQASKSAFLEFWDTKKDTLAIPVSEGIEAVQLMTIHKAKGLEFPVVLFPYADVNLYDAKNDTIWYPLIDSEFEEVNINFSSNLANFGDVGATLYNQHRETLELDNLNLLYVTLTRAVEHLYVFSEIPSEKNLASPKSYNDLFGAFLKHHHIWDPGKLTYEFGDPNKALNIVAHPTSNQVAPTYIASIPEEHNLKIITTDTILWEAEIEQAISAGNLLHDTMAQIKSKEDIPTIFETLKDRSILTSEEFQTLFETVNRITSHPELEKFFETSESVKVEADIITATGGILRPDRLNFRSDNKVTIIDYKTGTPNYHHEDQINGYAIAISEMGYHVSEKILIYTNGEEIMINKV